MVDPPVPRAKFDASRLFDSPLVLPLMILPAVLFLLFFVGYPLVYNLVMSFQEVTVRNLAMLDKPFVGLENYLRLIEDPIFDRVLRNTVIFVAANVALQFLLGLAVALFFNQPFPGAGYLRGLIVAGWMLPPLVIGAVWKWILSSEFGVLNEALRMTGITGSTIYWLSDPNLALISVTIANIWFGLPFNMILLSAGLSNLPKDLYEAANLDGASRGQSFRFITLPLLKPTILAVTALSTIYTLRAFDVLWSMTGGGPVDASNIFPLWSYILSFSFFDFGRGAAVSTMLFAIVFIVATIYIRSLASEERL